MTRGAVAVLAAAAAIAASARLDLPVPGSPVPQSAQTLAVLLAGVVLGTRRGGAAVLAYLAAGALGAPVFADGAAGPRHLAGPTAGYLVGFVLAAAWTGWSAGAGHLQRFPAALAVMAAGHVLILGLGWVRLTGLIDPGTAWVQGVEPFLLGGGVKSVLAAALAVLWMRRIGASHQA